MTLHWPIGRRDVVFVDQTRDSDWRALVALAVSRWEVTGALYGARLSRLAGLAPVAASAAPPRVTVDVVPGLTRPGRATVTSYGEDLLHTVALQVRPDVFGDRARLGLLVHLIGHAVGLEHAELGVMAVDNDSAQLDGAALDLVREAYRTVDAGVPALEGAATTQTVHDCGRA